MANKHDVLRLLAKGLTPNQVAERLGCLPAYVRATRQRATPEGREKQKLWDEKRRQNPEWRAWKAALQREQYQNNPQFREKSRAAHRKWYAKHKLANAEPVA